jgi:hypothetical protein
LCDAIGLLVSDINTRLHSNVAYYLEGDHITKDLCRLLFSHKLYMLSSNILADMKVTHGTISVEVYKPAYHIGQEVYIPEKDRVVQTKIADYEVCVREEAGALVGVVSCYHLLTAVDVRRGAELELTDLVRDADLYTDKAQAEAASVFIPVAADFETWRLAIGDRTVADEASPYNIANSGLPTCCANISDARDILYLCRSEGGLIAHERDYLAELLAGHDLKSDSASPLGTILGQLGILSDGHK